MRKPPVTNDPAIKLVITWAEKELAERTADTEVRRDLYLRSPDGGVWQVTVDDAGTLAATKVKEG